MTEPADAIAIEVAGRRIEIRHPDKVLFPAGPGDGGRGITKAEVVRYYLRIADRMLPHLAGRPLTLHRFPDGVGEEGFYQKQASDHFPQWIRRAEVAKEGGTVDHVVCDDAATLVYLAGQATIALHVWLSRAAAPRRPDRLVLDLDPPAGAGAGSLAGLRAGARAARDLLAELALDSYPMTTGSSGFHVVAPLRPEHDFDQVRAIARAVARRLAECQPERLTTETRKAQRGDRIFVDYLRNGYAQTAVAPYSLRALPGAPVATPLGWDEIGRAEPRRYDLGNLFRRLGQRDDPWAGLAANRQALDLERASALLGAAT